MLENLFLIWLTPTTKITRQAARTMVIRSESPTDPTCSCNYSRAAPRLDTFFYIMASTFPRLSSVHLTTNAYKEKTATGANPVTLMQKVTG